MPVNSASRRVAGQLDPDNIVAFKGDDQRLFLQKGAEQGVKELIGRNHGRGILLRIAVVPVRHLKISPRYSGI